MIAEKIECVLATWSQHNQAGGLNRRVFEMGCERLHAAAVQMLSLPGSEVLSNALQRQVQDWRRRTAAGERLDIVAFVMGCGRIRQTAAQVRRIEERALAPVGTDASELEAEAIQHWAAEMIAPENAWMRG